MGKHDETLSREDVELMIRDWQSECADQPSLHNQANVLLSRLKIIRPTIHHRAASKIRLEQQSFQTGDDARFADGYSEGLAFALDALELPKTTFSSDDEALELLEKYGHQEASNGVIRGDWRSFNDACRDAVQYLCDEWDFVFEHVSALSTPHTPTGE